jgi:hypothetical protein
VGNKKRREEKSSRRLSFAPKEHWKLASYEVAGKSAENNSSRKGRWKTSSRFPPCLAARNQFADSNFVAG